MPAKIDPLVIGIGGKPQPLNVYLRWDRTSALVDYLCRNYGLLLPPDWKMPRVTELAANHQWPDRILIEAPL